MLNMLNDDMFRSSLHEQLLLCVSLYALLTRTAQGSGLPNRTKMFSSCGMADVPVWGLISEDILTEEAKLPEGYVDNGEEH